MSYCNTMSFLTLTGGIVVGSVLPQVQGVVPIVFLGWRVALVGATKF